MKHRCFEPFALPAQLRTCPGRRLEDFSRRTGPSGRLRQGRILRERRRHYGIPAREVERRHAIHRKGFPTLS